MKFVNLTPHEITLVREDGSKLSIEPSGAVARVKVTIKQVGSIAGIPTFITTNGDVEGFPCTLLPDTVYIVSRMVKDKIESYPASPLKNITTVVPGKPIKDDNGNVIGCEGFSLN